MSKLTKQGVRDLNHIGRGKSKGLKLAVPPKPIMCKHPMVSRRSVWHGYEEVCEDCGAVFDWIEP